MTTNIDVEVAPPPQSSDFRGGGGGYGARVISKDSTVDEGGTPSSDDEKKSRNKAGGAPTPPPQSTKNGATTTATAMSTTKTTTPPPSHDEGGSTGIAATPEAASSQLPSTRPRHRISDDDDDEDDDEDDDIVASLAEGLGGVSISSSAAVAPPPSLPHPGGGRRGTAVWKTAPEAIKNIAALLSSDKYTNIVVLTGEAATHYFRSVHTFFSFVSDATHIIDVRSLTHVFSDSRFRSNCNRLPPPGAGVSCNAGIPDFRSPGTGLYDNLQKYDLPFPEAVFDLGFYGRNPDPFVHLASELWPGLRHSPTITHSFIALLERKGLLLRNYTQVRLFVLFCSSPVCLSFSDTVGLWILAWNWECRVLVLDLC